MLKRKRKRSNNVKISQEELSWLNKAKKGDRRAFGHLMEAYQRPVFNMAYRMLGERGEAEEATQEVFIRVFTRLETYDPSRKFSTWILSITSNYCIDLLRKRRIQLLSIDEPLPAHPALMSDKMDTPEAHASRSEQKEMVQQLIETLPAEYREAVILRYWYDHSYTDIAEAQNASVGAIKSRLFRARKMLAQAAVEMDKMDISAVYDPNLQPMAM